MPLKMYSHSFATLLQIGIIIGMFDPWTYCLDKTPSTGKLYAIGLGHFSVPHQPYDLKIILVLLEPFS